MFADKLSFLTQMAATATYEDVPFTRYIFTLAAVFSPLITILISSGKLLGIVGNLITAKVVSVRDCFKAEQLSSQHQVYFSPQRSDCEIGQMFSVKEIFCEGLHNRYNGYRNETVPNSSMGCIGAEWQNTTNGVYAVLNPQSVQPESSMLAQAIVAFTLSAPLMVFLQLLVIGMQQRAKINGLSMINKLFLNLFLRIPLFAILTMPTVMFQLEEIAPNMLILPRVSSALSAGIGDGDRLTSVSITSTVSFASLLIVGMTTIFSLLLTCAAALCCRKYYVITNPQREEMSAAAIARVHCYWAILVPSFLVFVAALIAGGFYFPDFSNFQIDFSKASTSNFFTLILSIVAALEVSISDTCFSSLGMR